MTTITTMTNSHTTITRQVHFQVHTETTNAAYLAGSRSISSHIWLMLTSHIWSQTQRQIDFATTINHDIIDKLYE